MSVVEVVRVLPAPVTDVRPLLTPELIVEYEGRHGAHRVVESESQTIVTVRPSGHPLPRRYRFEPTDDGLWYRTESDRPPLLRVETTITLQARNGETEIRLQAAIDRRVPIPFFLRYARFRHGRRLRRLADRLADELEPNADRS